MASPAKVFKNGSAGIVPARAPATQERQQIGVGTCLISASAKKLILQVLESNRLSAGPMTQQFESDIARLHGCRFGLFCNSGTSALQIALAAIKERERWSDGDEVLVPAVTFVATSNVVLYNGLRPVFVDVEPDHYCIDPGQIERHITPRTRAIMPVHIGGLPSDMDPIVDIARKHGLHIVEDSCEAMFVRYKGQPVGSFSTIGCFSTYIAHIITTGVGGVCVTNDPEYQVMLRSLMNHGRDAIYIRIDDDQGLKGEKLFEVASKRFSFTRLGHSFRATEMEAALGLAQISERENTYIGRVNNARRLTEGLAGLEEYIQLPEPRPHAEHGYMFYPIVVNGDRVSRDRVIQYLETNAIETRYLLPLINQPVYRQMFGDLDSQYPIAARLNRDAFYIGCHAGMTDEDVDYVVAHFHEFFSRTSA